MLTQNISPDLHSFIEATLDSERLKLISFLTEKPFLVLDLAEKKGGNPAAIMRHLEVLVEANLVKATDKDGKTVYRFDSKKLELMARRQ
jgi:DNA-binding transcriptional ArsR family regulator